MSLSIKEIITLNNLFGIGSKILYKVGQQEGDTLLDRITACNGCIRENGHRIPVEQRHIIQSEQAAEQIILKSKEAGVHLLPFYDEKFPSQLKQITNEKGEPDFPFLLYCKGDISVLQQPCLAIVGTRQPTTHAEKAARYLAEQFVQEGLCIVSGLALGCDTFSHQGALRAGGHTIAFLAHGLDTIFPPSNQKLALEIIHNGGALISEYPIGTSFNKYNFIQRDRLQAGMSLATLVIQTNINGGTMHVANATLNAGKKLYVCYFNDETIRKTENCSGNEVLVKKGATYLKGNDNISQIADEIKHLQQTRSLL